MMERCIAAGRTITGEHGVGLDKLDYMRLVHDDVAIGLMTEIRDLFDPHGLSNPGKLLPPLEGATPTRGVEDEDGGGTHGVLYYDPADLTISVRDRKSTRLNSSHVANSYAVYCLKKKTEDEHPVQ